MTGSAYTSVSFLKTFHPALARNEKWLIVVFIAMLIETVMSIAAPILIDQGTADQFLTEQLLKAESVANVKTSLVIRCAKDEPGLSFDVLEARLARNA